MTLTPQMIAGLSTFVGALLFFGAGFLLAKLRCLPAEGEEDITEVMPLQDPDQSLQEMQELQQRLKSAQDQCSFIHQEKQEIQAVVDKLSADNKAFTAAARNRFLKMKKELDDATAQNAALREELENLSVQSSPATSLNEEMLMEKASLQEALNAIEDEKDALSAKLSELENTNHELMIKTQKLADQGQEIETLRDESSSLREQLAEMEVVQKELKQLRKENKKLLSMGLALQEPPQKPTLSPSLEGIGGACQKLVSHLAQEKNSRGVVMADELGLPIAGTGEHVEAMAAMAAIFSTVSERIESMLPFGDTSRITVNNSEDLTITLQPVDVDADRLIVSSLSVGAGPTREQLINLIDEEISN